MTGMLACATTGPLGASSQATRIQGIPHVLKESLPDAPQPTMAADPKRDKQSSTDELSLKSTPRRLLYDEWGIVSSPGRISKHDLYWLVPLAAASAGAIATDSNAMRNMVSSNPEFNASNNTVSDVLRGAFIGTSVGLFAGGELAKNQRAREAGLLAGEAMVNAYATSEAIKYIMLRERPFLDEARGHFFSGDATSDPSFVSGHTIVAWSSAAVLAGEYTKPWQQAGIYTAATAASLTRILAQQHFPSDVLLGSVSGWLIGHYVLQKHHRIANASR